MAGIPILVQCRLRPRGAGAHGAGDAKVPDSNSLQLLRESGAPGKGDDLYKVGAGSSYQCVFDKDTRPTEIFETRTQELIHSFCEGYNTAVFTFGQSESGKTHTLVGNKEGILQKSYAEAASIMQLKQQKLGAAMRPATIKLQIFEIFEEEIRDLLVSASPVLSLEVTDDDGPVVKGLSYKQIDEEWQLQQAIDKVSSNRVPHVTDFGPGANFTTTFYILELVQTYEGSTSREYKSRLQIIDTPGSEKLAEDPETLMVKEGTYLNKSILSLGRVISDLGSGDSDFVDFQQCVLTQLLEDVLIGNCETLCLALLAPWDFANSKSTMNYVKMVERMKTYPIINETNARGLLKKYRRDLSRVNKDLVAAQAAAEKQETRSLLLKINELEGKTLEEATARVKLHFEKDQLYEKVVAFREKYNKLVESKAELQQKLINSEEERLRVSKALIDLEIEKNRAQESFESKNYEVMNRALNAENEMMQFQMRDEENTKTLANLNVENENLREEHKQLALELVALKENYLEEKNNSKAKAKEKDDISLEMVNLINAKKRLTENETVMQKDIDEKAAVIKELREDIGTLQEERVMKDGEINMLKHTLEDLKQDVHRTQFELDNKTIQFEAEKVDVEKNYIAHTRDKDAEIFILKEKFDAERKKMEESRVELDEKLIELDRELRNEQQRRMMAEDECQEKSETERSLKQELDDLTRQKMELGDEYRAQIRQNMEKVADLAKAFEGQGATAGKQGQLRAEIDRMVQMLIQSYTSKEDELREDKDRFKSKVEDLVARNTRLHSAHRRCREQLLALAPRGSTPQVEDVSALKAEGQMELDEDVINENKSLRRRLATVENELMQARGEQVNVNNTYQETIAELVGKGNKVSGELELLRKENSTLKAANKALEMGLETGGQDAKHMLDLQQQALTTITAIRDGGIQVRPTSGQATMEDMRGKQLIEELTDEKAQLLEVISRLNKDLSVAGADQMELRRVRQEKDLLNSQLDVITGSDNTRQQLSAMVVQLKEKIKELESGGAGGNLRIELREFTQTKQKELESERARLRMRCSMAEEKLKHMEEYMESTISKYQKEIMELKRNLSQAMAT